MSQTVDVDGMTLIMPAGWRVWKYDDSAFHRALLVRHSIGGVHGQPQSPQRVVARFTANCYDEMLSSPYTTIANSYQNR